jgi:anti-sigma B factor antagonist
MALSVAIRRVGEITVLTCSGRIADGLESASLLEAVEDAAPDGPWLVLDLAGIEFIDSSGLGLLVRLLARARNDGGDVKLCAPSRKIADALRVTRLSTVFDVHDTDAIAVQAFHRASPRIAAAGRRVDVLCLNSSPDALAYLRELFRGAGYEVVTADNVPDAVVLLSATMPGIVVVPAAQRHALESRAVGVAGAPTLPPIVELADGFNTQDAVTAGEALLDRVRARLGRDPAGAAPA